MKLSFLFREITTGKTLLRTLQSEALKAVRLKGKVIDLGAKSESAHYYQFIKKDDSVQITYTDFYSGSKDIVQLNLEEEFPIEANSYDFALLNNTLEHLFNFQGCINEAYRIIRPGGKLVGVVPYLMKIHPDPDDYFRYTASSLSRILKNAGFKEVVVKPLGYGPFTAGLFQYVEVLRIGILKFIALTSTIGIDKLFQKVFPKKEMFRSERYPITYFFEGVKD